MINWALDTFSKDLVWMFVGVAVITTVALVGLLKNNKYCDVLYGSLAVTMSAIGLKQI